MEGLRRTFFGLIRSLGSLDLATKDSCPQDKRRISFRFARSNFLKGLPVQLALTHPRLSHHDGAVPPTGDYENCSAVHYYTLDCFWPTFIDAAAADSGHAVAATDSLSALSKLKLRSTTLRTTFALVRRSEIYVPPTGEVLRSSVSYADGKEGEGNCYTAHFVRPNV